MLGAVLVLALKIPHPGKLGSLSLVRGGVNSAVELVQGGGGVQQG